MNPLAMLVFAGIPIVIVCIALAEITLTHMTIELDRERFNNDVANYEFDKGIFPPRWRSRSIRTVRRRRFTEALGLSAAALLLWGIWLVAYLTTGPNDLRIAVQLCGVLVMVALFMALLELVRHLYRNHKLRTKKYGPKRVVV